MDFRNLILARLAGVMPQEELRRWLEPLSWEHDPEKGELRLLAPTVFHQREAARRTALILAQAAECGRPLRRLTVECRRPAGRPVPVVAATVAEVPAPRFQALNAAHSFERFIGGQSNRLARLALEEFASGSGLPGIRSLLLVASGPWGKTHLLEALALRLIREPRRAFLKLPGDETPARPLGSGFWREKELVIVDGVHLLAERPDLQAGLVQAFDEAGSWPLGLIFSSPQPPAKLTGLGESLRSRLGGGLVLKVDPPEPELLREMAQRRCRELGLEVSPEILDVLVREAGSDPRRLLGFLETAAFITAHSRLSLSEAIRMLGPGGGAAETRVRVETILSGVAAAFGLKVSDLTGHSKLRQAAWPRRVAMLLAREMTGLTTTEIGEALGGRDHSTVIHALKKIQEELRNPTQARLVENIKRSLIVAGG